MFTDHSYPCLYKTISAQKSLMFYFLDVLPVLTLFALCWLNECQNATNAYPFIRDNVASARKILPLGHF